MTTKLPELPPLEPKELLGLMIRHFGIREGLYDLSVRFKIATGTIGPKEDRLLPGVMIGISSFEVVPVEHRGPNTLDAAECNPKKTERTRRTPKTEDVA